MITVKSKKGFSLTELVVVIAIIGILSILVIPAYS
ncbi:prepilin-type N-terminal cleavage/methylation domain-containing protein, partial [Francisella tularensis subsp. holarctica]